MRRPILVCLLFLMLCLGFAVAAPAGKSKIAGDPVRTATQKALKLIGQGRLTLAARRLEKTLQEAKKIYGPRHLKTAVVMDTLALVQQSLGNYKRAATLYRVRTSIAEEKLGPSHLSVGTGLCHLAGAYLALARWEKAETAARRSLDIIEGVKGKDDVEILASLQTLAAICQARGRLEEAEELHRRALAIAEAKNGPAHPKVADYLNNLGVFCRDLGRFEEAEALFRRGLVLAEKKGDSDGEATLAFCTILNDWGVLRQSVGECAEAAALYVRAIATAERRLGKDHPIVAAVLNNQARLCRESGQDTKAEPLYRRSLQITEKNLGEDHPGAAACLHTLGGVFLEQRRTLQAKKTLKQALAIRENMLGANHPETVQTVQLLAHCYQPGGRPDEARLLYERYRKVIETLSNNERPDLIASYNNLALLHESSENEDDPGALYDRAAGLARATFGNDHPIFAECLNRQAAFQARTGVGDPGELFDQARRIARKHAVSVVPMLSEVKQGRFILDRESVDFETALSYALSFRDPATRLRSAEWLLNGKAIGPDILAAAASCRSAAGGLNGGTKAQELNTIRQQLAHLSVAVPRPGGEKCRFEQMARLTQRERELSLQLGRAARDAWLTVEELQKKLPSGTAFIDFARFRPVRFDGNSAESSQPARYFASITTKEQSSQVVDLGPADAIDAAVAEVRRQLDDSPATIRELGETAAEKVLRKKLEEAGKLVLAPLRTCIDGAESWIVSPEGNLWHLPWAALPLSDDAYVIEKRKLSFVVSGRDLLREPTKGNGGESLVVADPDFDLARSDAAAETAKLPRGTASLSDSRAASGGLELGEFQRLSATGAEAPAMVPKIEALTGLSPKIYSDKQAVEGIVKAAKSPRFLVLSTHGYFLPDQQRTLEKTVRPMAPIDACPTPRTREGRVWENPLLRCGLLLAGCNDTQTDLDHCDDGVLTGLEVVGLDLRDTELVILSACQTGLGDVQNGGAVAGLRQAFHLAGAGAVIATLWPVPDRQSTELMVAFFDQLTAGKTKADALREAQLGQIRKHRRAGGGAHPYFWAAHTLTGS